MDHGIVRAATLTPIAKTISRLAGWALSLIALFFFARQVGKAGVAFPDRGVMEIASVLSVAGVVYGLAVALLSWIWLLLASNGLRLGRGSKLDIASSYLTSQFAKYLPGNVFQYVARHALGRRFGIGHGELAAAALVEAGMLACAASILVILFGMPVLHALFPKIPILSPGLAMILLLVIPALHYLPNYLPAAKWVPRYSIRTLTLALGGYLVFFLIFGGLFVGMLHWTSATTPAATQVIGGSSAAWLIGFLIPGAPAGAGLREAALALATGASKPSREVLSAIILFRFVTLLGDLLAFGGGKLVSRSVQSAGAQTD